MPTTWNTANWSTRRLLIAAHEATPGLSLLLADSGHYCSKLSEEVAGEFFM